MHHITIMSDISTVAQHQIPPDNAHVRRLWRLGQHLSRSTPAAESAVSAVAPLQQLGPSLVGGFGRDPIHLANGELFETWQRPFTTRPELEGKFGMVASSDYVASAAGMRVLELGGNAFDAAVATGAVMWHTQPGDLSPGGEVRSQPSHEHTSL